MALRSISIADIIRRNARLFPDRIALVCAEARITHREYLARVERLAAGLMAAGIGKGDRVAVLARNTPEYADLYGAVAFIGAILLPVNWRLSVDEVAYVLTDGAPKLVIAGPEDQPTVAAVQGSLSSVTGFYAIGASAPPFKPFADLTAAAGPLPDLDTEGGEGYVIIHTAAVDGRPRGALISQRGLIAGSIQQLHACQIDDRDVGVVAVPLFHVTGLGLMLTLQLAGGTSLIPPRFDPADTARLIAAEKATVFAEFAPMLMTLLDKASEIGADLGSVRAVLGLDTAETIARFEASCPNARFWGYTASRRRPASSPCRDGASAQARRAGRPFSTRWRWWTSSTGCSRRATSARS